MATGQHLHTPEQVDRFYDSAITFRRQIPYWQDVTRLVPVVYRLRARGRPDTVEEVAAEVGQPASTVAESFRRIPGYKVDPEGRISGGPPPPDPAIRVEHAATGRLLDKTACSPGAVMIAYFIGEPVRITTQCHATGEPIIIKVDPAGVHEARPSTAVASVVAEASLEDPGAVCKDEAFFISADAAADWLADHPHADIAAVTDTVRTAARAAQEFNIPR